MPSVLLITFCLQLLIHALNTLFPQTITELLWLLYTKLPTPQSSDAQETVRLKKEVVRLHREMSATSAQDDFAKWARLRREHDKAKAKYEEKGTYSLYWPASQPELLGQGCAVQELTDRLISQGHPKLPRDVRQIHFRPPLARHAGVAVPVQCLLQQATDVLPPAVLGTLPSRMGA